MLNLTLLVQMIHFGIAYVILDRFFLRFMVRHLMHEDEQFRALEASVQKSSHEIHTLTVRQEDDWRTLALTLHNKKPLFKAPRAAQQEYFIVKPSPLTEDHIERLAHEVKDDIVTRVMKVVRS